MRKPDLGSYPVIEYSKEGLRIYDPATAKSFNAVRLADASDDLSKRQVVIALSRRSSFVRSTRLPDVDRSALDAILGLQAVQLFPVATAELSIDAAYADSRNGEGRLATLAACKSDQLRSLHEELDAVGLRPVTILPAGWASVKVAAALGHPTCAVIGNGKGEVSIDLVWEGALASSRSVPKPDSVDALQAEINRSMAALGLPQCPIVCTGGASLPGAEHWPEDPLAIVAGDASGPSLELPEARKAKASKEEHRKRNLALLLWVAALGVAAIVVDGRLDNADHLKKDEAQWVKHLKAVKAENGLAQAKAQELRQEQQVLSTAFDPKQPLTDVTTVLSNLTPEGLWLTGVSIERGKRATLRGTAKTGEAVSTYLASLGQQNRLRDVKLVYRNNTLIDKTPVVNFSISMHIVGNFPLTDKLAEKGGNVARRS